MNESTIPQVVARACEVAAGLPRLPEEEKLYRIRGAEKDLNAKGRGPWWYRLVWRDGAWEYVSQDRLPTGTYLARDRRATVYGNVMLGEIVVQHDRGGPIDAAYLVAPSEASEDGKTILRKIELKRFRGQLIITLPDGRGLELPDPRK